MQNSSLNLVQAVAALQKRWTTLLFMVIACTAVAAITVFVMPPYYKSQASLVAANTVLADKARLFNNQIQNLYSYFGSGDDLDRIAGIGEMDTSFQKIVDEFSLVEYYHLSGDGLPVLRQKAVLLLRKDLRLIRTDNGQLQVIAWTKNRELSARIINCMIAIIEETASGIWQKNYRQSQEKLRQTIAEMEQEYQTLSDSIPNFPEKKRAIAVAKAQSILDQIRQYRFSADEFRLASQIVPPVLYVLEPATPHAYAQRPDKTAIIIATAIASLLFACGLVLVSDRKNIA